MKTAVGVSVLFNISMDVQLHHSSRSILSMWQTYCHHAAKKFIQTADTVISTFRFSSLHIKKIYYLPDKLEYDFTSFLEVQS